MKPDYCYSSKCNDYIVKIEVTVSVSAYDRKDAIEEAKDKLKYFSNTKVLSVKKY